MLRVHVLGELLVESDGRPIELTGSWRARSLLAWFALNPGSHPRAEVAARFWPDVLDSSARASLRNALWALRRAFGEDAAQALVATRERVGLEAPPVVWVDAVEFREQLATDRLEEALELCRGELLAGLDEEWVYEHRDAHRECLSELLERVAAQAEAEGDVAGAIASTRRRAALDPLAEDAHRALIERLARSGDRAGALAAYGRLRERFRKELGISVSEETRRAAHRAREDPGHAERATGDAPRATLDGQVAVSGGTWMPGAMFPLPPRLRQRAQSGFVGREGELALLREWWSAARGGEGARLALVTGEAGIGKSRLVRELALEGRDQGAVVLHGSADEDLLVPHQHLVEALGHLFSVAAPDELRRRVDHRAADLAPISPALPGGPGERHEGASEGRRYRLVEAVASLLDELSADAPVLLLIDDLHWADQSTAAILRHVLESRPEARLLVLATQRPADTPATGPSAEALQRLAQGQFVERLPLSGLSDPDIARLAEGLSGRNLAAELVSGIREETGGNAFFVQELVRDLSESDRTGSVLSLSRAEVPDRVREVVSLRLARLGEASVRLLAVAAVIGSEFVLPVLEQVSDLEGDDLTAALDEAVAAALLFETTQGDTESFAFSHALVRRTLLTRLTRPNRRRVHARVAKALEALRGDEALLEIAHHLCEARPVADREEALDYASRAAERAVTGLAYAEAVELFTRAVSLLPAEDPRRRRLALKRAVAYQGLFHALADTKSDESDSDLDVVR
ncbi:MAG TPA: AAA family ATPase [Thermoleophilaceae bacterium]|nr:AAA family ATPase [Thermoleophilaceae bacterium]